MALELVVSICERLASLLMTMLTGPDDNTRIVCHEAVAGWVWAQDHTAGCGLEPVAQDCLSPAEREAYASRSVRRRRHWLMGRVAAKEAVRGWRMKHSMRTLAPREIAIHADRQGRPNATMADTEGPSLSIAHSGEIAVAIASAAPVGIDVEACRDLGAGVEAIALSPREQLLLRKLASAKVASAGDGGSRGLQSRTFLRFWTAKEAVAKARGTGLCGQLSSFAIEGIEQDTISIVCRDNATGAAHKYAVETGTVTHNTHISNLRAEYIVAWTVRSEASSAVALPR